MEEEVKNQEETPKEEEKELTYVRILPGEKIEDVAKRFDTSVEEILKNNKINPDYIQPNQWVFV